MSLKRPARAALIGCAGLAMLALALAPSPGLAKSRKVTKTFSTCQATSQHLADDSSLQVPFTVRGAHKGAKPVGGRVVRVESVGLRIAHTFDRDITVFLVSPTGLVDPLVLGRGDTGDNFGSGETGCGGTLTTFTDGAPGPIGEAAVPFAGSFKPEAPLSVFAGSRAAGTWRVVVSDGAPGDTGTLYAVSFRVTYRYKSS
jgi:hypothetical protein